MKNVESLKNELVSFGVKDNTNVWALLYAGGTYEWALVKFNFNMKSDSEEWLNPNVTDKYGCRIEVKDSFLVREIKLSQKARKTYKINPDFVSTFDY